MSRAGITDATIARHRAEIDDLITDFRATATRLIALARADGIFDAYDNGEEYADHIVDADGRWWLHIHDPHCRFEHRRSGEVVEAHIYDPRSLDPYFLLEFARTSGRHPAVLEACAEGFHDMARVLDVVADAH